MNCDLLQPQLTALMDGELTPDVAAAAEAHLAECPTCAKARRELAEAQHIAGAWTIDAPDISARVLQAAALEEQGLLLSEIRLLRTEMAELRAEVAALRSQTRRSEVPLWTPPARTEHQDHPRMENDPWNLVRS